MAAPYRFGEGDVASERLALLARLFEPTSRSFLARDAPDLVGVAVDLGCGPGHTTALLAEVTGAEHVWGLDASADSIGRCPAGPGRTFAVHDVTSAPFPSPPADVIYARYLLAHLPEPERVISTWRSQLAPGGRLLLEEMDGIRSDVDVLATYLATVTDVLAHDGAAMYAGERLGDLPATVVEVSPPVATVARMFGMNLPAWRQAPHAIERYGDAFLDDIGAGLAEVAADPPAGATITWTMRQAVTA